MSRLFPEKEQQITPRRLELSLNEDGSLQTAPLLSVLTAATDGLYSDLYNMAQGELEITSAIRPEDEHEDAPQEPQPQPQPPAEAAASTVKGNMSNLSFAQRRHEIGWRLALHGKALTHVAALTAAAASTDLATASKVSTKALQHARDAWWQADEAQDALYFFHAQLFPVRQAPCDVYGALDTLLARSWPDMPQDLQLTVDRYDQSKEKSWSPREVADQWNMAVRDKLLRGEMGWMAQNNVSVPWNISLRGGVVRLTHGRPKTTIVDGSQKVTYPMEAVLTVLSTSQELLEWTLASVEVHAQAKTGQSNHQLDTTNRQRFDLHRLCALAMSREEARIRLHNENVKKVAAADSTTASNMQCEITLTARPLNSLFQVAHVFGLSWQLEILSAQAQALRKGLWGTSSNFGIVVTPVQFFENRSILGIVSISFWSVDDRYGPQCMGDLQLDDDDDHEGDDGKNATPSNGNKHHSSSDSVSTVSRSINTPSVTNQLSLSVRAEPNVGIRVSLSGAESVMEFAAVQPHIRSTIHQLLEATSNPFCLSASEALLAATRLCAERKCHAMVQALPSFLPPWISLSVEKGSIAVAARIQYHGVEANGNNVHVILFRLTCDARTGSFVSTFSKSTKLLQYLACNALQAASDTTSLRIASLAKHRQSRGLVSVRAVRDAFEGLNRSMNVLGQRAGVGGSWKDNDGMSASLRQRAIQTACKDVKVSLVTCCGMAAVYGLSVLALGAATGVGVSPDM